MYRYLLNISYIGTHFRGLQKNLDSQKLDLKSSVQGSIELALKKLKSVNEPKLILSSRTDAGVHALNSAVHVDLQRLSGQPYPVLSVTAVLNKFFKEENLAIRINEIEIVPDTFHVRYSAKGRTYLYRLGIAKNGDAKYEPIEEVDRCYFVKDPKFDIDIARQAAEIIKGKHDFRTFMGADQQDSKRNHPFYALRSIDYITIEEGHSTSTAFKADVEKAFNYWNIQISGRSFLNRQVRRIVGVILAVAQHRLTLRHVYEMLTIPSKNSWCPQAVTVPARGLYLCHVNYDKKDKEFLITD